MELSHFIGRLLLDDPAERPQSAQRVLSELTVVSRLLTGSGTAETEDALHTTTRHDHPTRRVVSPRQRVGWLGFMGLAVIVALVAWQVPGWLSEPQPEPISRKVPDPLSQNKTDPGDDELWCRKVQMLPARDQWTVIVDRLEVLNPGYRKEKVAGWIEPESVLRFGEKTDVLTDIRPLQCFADLKTLALTGSRPGLGKLTNLAPLKGMRLFFLNVARNPNLVDLSPLAGMPLNKLDISDTGVKDLAPLTSVPLEILFVARTRIEDLSPLQSLSKLRVLDCQDCPVRSLEPLAKTGLTELRLTFQPERDEAVLKRMSTLQTINGMPVKEFWRTQSDSP